MLSPAFTLTVGAVAAPVPCAVGDLFSVGGVGGWDVVLLPVWFVVPWGPVVVSASASAASPGSVSVVVAIGTGRRCPFLHVIDLCLED